MGRSALAGVLLPMACPVRREIGTVLALRVQYFRTRMYKWLLLLLLLPTMALAQGPVQVKGTVSGSDGEKTFYDLMIVNRRTRAGTFGNTDGSFSAWVQRDDTLLIGAGGYVTRTLALGEFPDEELQHLKITLRPWNIDLQPVAVLPQRTLKQIQQDIEKLGYNEKDYRETGINALESPITFLYESFSRRERSKRLVAQLENEDKKRELLRELLQQYVDYGIINLSDDSFDDFIDFCNVSEEVLKSLSQYDFLLYMKKKYQLYTSLGPTRQH